MNYKKYRLICPLMLCALLAGCGSANDNNNASNLPFSEGASSSTATVPEEAAFSFDEEFSDRDLDSSYDSITEEIVLSDANATITITKEGTYVISGSVSNGQIIVDAPDAKVQLVLNGVDISNEESAAIYVKDADKVFVTLAEGTNNVLTCSNEILADGDTNVDGTIFAKSDLTINGTGTLDVYSCVHGIVSKDDLKITGGILNLYANEDALQGKDSVRISSSDSITILAGDDGIHSDSYLYIHDCDLRITQSYEGLEGSVITIDGGTIDIVASDDGMNAAGDSSTEDSSFNMMPGPGMMDGDDSFVLTINGGTIHVDAAGDGIDSNGLLYINGGEIYVDGPTNDGNGALDYGTSAYINGGTLVALGSSGMAESFSTDSAQCSILTAFEQYGAAGDVITISDDSGNVIITYTAAKAYNCVQLSSASIEIGKTYTLTAGAMSQTIEMTSVCYGETHGFGGTSGPQSGGQRPGEAPSDNPQPFGEQPFGGSSFDEQPFEGQRPDGRN